MPLIYPTAPAGTHDCRLEYIDANTIRLVRYGGNKLMINGKLEEIPPGGVSFAAWAGMTSYNALIVIAYMNSGVMTLGVFNDAIVLDGNGMATIASHPEYTIVGMVSGGLTTYQYTPTVGGVISYWNRRQKALQVSMGQATTAPPWVLMNNANVNWCAFAGDGVSIMYSGYTYITDAGGTTHSTVNVFQYGVGEVSMGHGSYCYSQQAGWPFTVGMNGYYTAPADNLYGARLYGGAAGGNGQWNINCGVLYEG